MKQIPKRLTYANVMSSLAVFLILGGGAAFAATKLAKNSVGTKQIKNNAVTAAKIKKNAVTTAKIKAGAITGAQIEGGAVSGSNIASNTVTGANINASSTPFTQAVARFHSSAQFGFGGSEPPIIPLGTYTQPAGQDDQILAGLTVSFSASCEEERDVEVFLLENPPAKLSELNIESVLGIALVENKGTGTFSKQTEFSSYPIGGLAGMNQVAPSASVTRSYGVLPLDGTCKSGSGVTVSNPQLDILGTK
ncbi:MAG TPA: hypothetical protein VND98_07710 [Solirubrobacterales bacterium]|nr:hypothetical protein [Solirubrobacterales bacterium]